MRGQGYSLEVLALLHGVVETFLFELGSALKSSGGKPVSSPLSLLSGG